ncbi:iron-containing alcohol dehydrogenase [Vibrio sp. TRT 17S01]|uniref:iron-containing alcohol dehydrogenase n=1 Tax=Vibrio sp. TRT 17S01 TaxID=3418505 RepID=UPI003CFADC99
MENFDFYNPTRIIFGEGRLDELNTLVPQDAKVMITYGGQSAVKFGTIDKVKAALGKRNIIEFGGIGANPAYETLEQGVQLAKQEGVGFLLAVGGGSVMDGTKFIALAMNHEGDDYQALLFNGFTPAPVEQATKVGCVVTLPATGSEANPAGVITYQAQKYVFMSPLVFPAFSFLDPTLTLTLSTQQVADGVADAFVHVIEQYLTYPCGAAVQDRMAEGLLLNLIDIGAITVHDNTNIEARKNFVWAATNALNGLIGVGVPQDWSTHMIGHELTCLHGIAHGRTLAIVLPHLLRVRKEHKREKLIQYAERVWGLYEGSEDARIDLAIDKTEDFFNSLGIQTQLSYYDIDASVIEKVTSNLEKIGATQLSETGTLTLEDVKKILTSAL